jgi:hypothetical protein
MTNKSYTKDITVMNASLNLRPSHNKIRTLLLFYSSFTLLIKFITLQHITPNIS